MIDEAVERARLDVIMGFILFRLSLLPTLSTGSYVPTGARSADTKPPQQAFQPNKGHSELEELRRRYDGCKTNERRLRVVEEALVELESWRRAEGAPEGTGITEEEQILEKVGYSAEEVARSFNLNPHRIRRIRARNDFGTEDGCPASSVKKKWKTEERREKVRELKRRNFPNRRIADAMGIPESTVRLDLKEKIFLKNP